MWRDPKPKRAFTSNGNSAVWGTASGSQLAGDGMPRSSKKRWARYLSAARRTTSGVGEKHDRAERVALLGQQQLIEVGERDDEPNVLLADQLLQRGHVPGIVDPRHDRSHVGVVDAPGASGFASTATVRAPARPNAVTTSTRCPAQVKRTAVTAAERNGQSGSGRAGSASIPQIGREVCYYPGEMGRREDAR